MKELSKEEQKHLCNMVLEAWDQYVEYGFLETVEKTDGHFQNQREKDIFHAGWLYGFQHSVNLSMMGEKLVKGNLPQQAGQN